MPNVTNAFTKKIDETVERSEWFNLLEAKLLRDLVETTYISQRNSILYNSINQDFETITKWKKLANKLDNLVEELNDALNDPEDH